MTIAPTGGVSTLVSDAAQPRPATAPVPEQTDASPATQADSPSQAVPPPSTDTGIDQDAPRDSHVDVTV
jgi:hypothetical protein